MSEAQCPQCGAPITQDFGVVTCAGCGTVLMVDFDGNIQRMESGESGGDASIKASADPSVIPSLPVEEHSVPDYSNPIEMTPETESSENQFADNSAAPIEVAPPSEYQDIFEDPVPSSGVSDVLADIQNFANSDLPTAPLTYTVVIEGIDRKELNQQLSEVLADQKFKIDIPETMKKLKDGRIELIGLNAVKASILVLRLRSLPLKISWRQHAYEN